MIELLLLIEYIQKYIVKIKIKSRLKILLWDNIFLKR